MSTSRSLIRPFIAITCIGLTALGLRNTYADNTTEKQLAEQIACPGTSCTARLISESRSALGQSFAYQTANKQGAGRQSSEVVQVECRRALIFLGDYACERKN